MASSHSPANVTFDEYLERERAAKFKANTGPVRFLQWRVVEVLSPSTREYDLGLKASFYRSIPSVKAVFLVDSEQVYVQTQNRDGGAWMLNEFTEKGQVEWVAGNYQFTVGDIYDGIDIPLPEDAGPEVAPGSPVDL